MYLTVYTRFPLIHLVLFSDLCLLVVTIGPAVAKALGAEDWLSTINAAFFLGQAIFQPLTGVITSMFTKKKVLYACNVIFIIGNVISACAYYAPKGQIAAIVMTAGRFVAGSGAGSLTAIPSIVSAEYCKDIIEDDPEWEAPDPLLKVGFWQKERNVPAHSALSLWGSAIFAFGASLGGLYGYWVSQLNWAFAFVFLAIAMAFFSLPSVCFLFLHEKDTTYVPPTFTEPEDAARRAWWRWMPVDWLGGLLLALFLGSLILGAGAVEKHYAFSTTYVKCCFALCGIGFVGLIVWEYLYRNIRPILPSRIITLPTSIGSYISQLFINASYLITYFFVPLFYLAQGHSLFQVGQFIIVPALANGALGVFCTMILFRDGSWFKDHGLAAGCIFSVGVIVGNILLAGGDYNRPYQMTIGFHSLVHASANIIIAVTGNFSTDSLALNSLRRRLFKDTETTVSNVRQKDIISTAMCITYLFRASAPAIGIAGASVWYEKIANNVTGQPYANSVLKFIVVREGYIFFLSAILAMVSLCISIWLAYSQHRIAPRLKAEAVKRNAQKLARRKAIRDRRAREASRQETGSVLAGDRQPRSRERDPTRSREASESSQRLPKRDPSQTGSSLSRNFSRDRSGLGGSTDSSEQYTQIEDRWSVTNQNQVEPRSAL